MGYQQEQSLPSETVQSDSPNDDPPPAYRPPLPPRQSELLEAPAPTWDEQDPRNASTDSLLPITSAGGRRRLLIVYIHGFLGDETSFQSFPAHVHNAVTPLVERTHVVHTKIYPKYRSRKHIVYARDNFSQLAPHESPTTDVILCGHSMGGLLSAEVALMPRDAAGGGGLMHRTLGTLNFDVPFLGMHPGVIASGLGSVFRPAPKSPEIMPSSLSPGSASVTGLSIMGDRASTNTSEATTNAGQKPASTSIYGPSEPASSTLSSTDGPVSPLSIPSHDPNYNPPFPNDVRLAPRTGWEGPLHFIKKHSNDLFQASRTYVTSHLEFGGAMADYQGLRRRYQALRALENIDDFRSSNRVRFINYYTASTGRPKPPKQTVSGHNVSVSEAPQHRKSSDHSTRSSMESPARATGSIGLMAPTSDRQHVSDVSADKTGDKPPEVQPSEASAESSDGDQTEMLTVLDPTPHTGNDGDVVEPLEELEISDQKPLSSKTSDLERSPNQDPAVFENLPAVPEEPIPPEPIDASQYRDGDALKIAQKDHERLTKAYKQAVKDRDSSIKDRQKIVAKRQKKLQRELEKEQKEQEKAKKEEQRRLSKEEKERFKKEKAQQKVAASEMGQAPRSPVSKSDTASHREPEILTADLERETPLEKQRDKKFCMLPPRLYRGERDPTWVRVFMKDVDEVGAHCGLFFSTYPHYEKFVQDVGEQIAEWIGHAEEVRTARTGS